MLAASALPALTDRTADEPAALRATSSPAWASRAGRSWTANSSRACARSPCRCTIARRDVVAAVNVSTSATRDSVEHVLAQYLPPLQRTAAAIDAELRLV